MPEAGEAIATATLLMSRGMESETPMIPSPYVITCFPPVRNNMLVSKPTCFNIRNLWILAARLWILAAMTLVFLRAPIPSPARSHFTVFSKVTHRSFKSSSSLLPRASVEAAQTLLVVDSSISASVKPFATCLTNQPSALKTWSSRPVISAERSSTKQEGTNAGCAFLL